jgi:hypothetical protein
MNLFLPQTILIHHEPLFSFLSSVNAYHYYTQSTQTVYRQVFQSVKFIKIILYLFIKKGCGVFCAGFARTKYPTPRAIASYLKLNLHWFLPIPQPTALRTLECSRIGKGRKRLFRSDFERNALKIAAFF